MHNIIVKLGYVVLDLTLLQRMDEKKCIPYTTKEKLILVELVKVNSIIEDKKTDSSTIQEKNQAWEIITARYNVQHEITCKRSSKQLKKLWQNLKHKKRKETTFIKHQRLATGGGPPCVVTKDPVMNVIEDVAPHMDVSLPCPWDSTGVVENEIETPIYENDDHLYAIATEQLPNEEHEINDSENCNLPLANNTQSENLITKPSRPRPFVPRGTKQVTTPTTPKRGTQKNTELLQKESNTRILKVEESTKQQKECHIIRMEIQEAELQKLQMEIDFEEEIRQYKLHLIKAEVKRAELEVEKMTIEKEKAVFEKKIAEIKLNNLLGSQCYT